MIQNNTENTRYIIREVPAGECDFSSYFEDEGLTEKCGDFCCNLFIISNEGYGRLYGFNIETYTDVVKQAENIVYEFANIGGWNNYASYKEVMRDFSIDYNPRKCHLLKEWAKNADTYKTESIAEYLSIITDKKWEVATARGYCQGDYVEIVYCPEYYQDGVEAYGEVWLGAAREFCVIELDDDGEEVDYVCGFIVADCQAYDDSDCKKLVCDWYRIREEEATLEVVDSYSTCTIANYKTV